MTASVSPAGPGPDPWLTAANDKTSAAEATTAGPCRTIQGRRFAASHGPVAPRISIQRSVYVLTRLWSRMKAAAPSRAPPSVPVPPMMTINRASPDVVQKKASGEMEPLSCV